MSGIKIKFESNQEYQINAVNAVADLFEGRTKIETVFGLQFVVCMKEKIFRTIPCMVGCFC